MKNISLDYLNQKYPWRGLPVSQMPTWPEEAHRLFRWFERFTGKNISEINILDLGCGNGNFMCVMNELGAKGVYGIEEEIEYVEKAKELLTKNSFLPNVIEGSYYKSDLMKDLVFFDGIRLSDLDLFHLNAYEGLLNNKELVLDNCFLKFSKKGDYLLLHPGLIKENAFYDAKNLKLIFQDDSSIATLVQKL